MHKTHEIQKGICRSIAPKIAVEHGAGRAARAGELSTENSFLGVRWWTRPLAEELPSGEAAPFQQIYEEPDRRAR
jgi:hypothetical protein